MLQASRDVGSLACSVSEQHGVSVLTVGNMRWISSAVNNMEYLRVEGIRLVIFPVHTLSPQFLVLLTYTMCRSPEPVSIPQSARMRSFGVVTALDAALKRCTPLNFSPGMAGAVAGRPIAIRFVDDRTIDNQNP